MGKTRADLRLCELELAESRAKAQALILAGKVYCGASRVEKPGSLVASEASLRVLEPTRYVSRGGFKLEAALADFNLDLSGTVCADLGASTGGFTDCLLKHGARLVYAVDVGDQLLHERLRGDRRVVVMERTNARHLDRSSFGSEALDLIVVDVSFIGLDKLLAPIASLLDPGKHLLAMIKPQFEAGREQARKARGVIRDAELRRQVLDETVKRIATAGFELLSRADSKLHGPKGNIEHFALARRIGQRLESA